jgi:hypothetical protein
VDLGAVTITEDTEYGVFRVAATPDQIAKLAAFTATTVFTVTLRNYIEFQTPARFSGVAATAESPYGITRLSLIEPVTQAELYRFYFNPQVSYSNEVVRLCYVGGEDSGYGVGGTKYSNLLQLASDKELAVREYAGQLAFTEQLAQAGLWLATLTYETTRNEATQPNFLGEQLPHAVIVRLPATIPAGITGFRLNGLLVENITENLAAYAGKVLTLLVDPQTESAKLCIPAEASVTAAPTALVVDSDFLIGAGTTAEPLSINYQGLESARGYLQMPDPTVPAGHVLTAQGGANASYLPLPASTASSTILSGAGVPNASLGANGDFYLDTASATRELYGPKTAGAWGTGVSLVGASSGGAVAAAEALVNQPVTVPTTGMTDTEQAYTLNVDGGYKDPAKHYPSQSGGAMVLTASTEGMYSITLSGNLSASLNPGAQLRVRLDTADHTPQIITVRNNTAAYAAISVPVSYSATAYLKVNTNLVPSFYRLAGGAAAGLTFVGTYAVTKLPQVVRPAALSA